MHARTMVTVVAMTATLTALGWSPAQADGARTTSGSSTDDPDVFLTYVGCDSIFGPATAPQPRINLGPYAAPMGRRSLGLVPPAPGSASGPYATFASLSRIQSSVSVAATGGAQGVSYVMAITSSSPAGTAWSGRASISAAAGSWSTVTPSSLSYDWSLVDLATRSPVGPAGTGTPAEFATEHGDGAGFVVTGFGCDGQAFNLDAVRGSGSAFDFEGVSLSTSVAADRAQVASGDEVAITGRVSDGGGRVTGDPLVLESRTPGGAWGAVGNAVSADHDGLSRVVVPVTETTEFRWHRPESQYADEGWSDAVTVTVKPADAPTAPATK